MAKEEKIEEIDVTKDFFNIYISGIDTYGSVNKTSRSDVNLILSVNPKSNQILITSIPRDYYVVLADKKGLKDKLNAALNQLHHTFGEYQNNVVAYRYLARGGYLELNIIGLHLRDEEIESDVEINVFCFLGRRNVKFRYSCIISGAGCRRVAGIKSTCKMCAKQYKAQQYHACVENKRSLFGCFLHASVHRLSLGNF